MENGEIFRYMGCQIVIQISYEVVLMGWMLS